MSINTVIHSAGLTIALFIAANLVLKFLVPLFVNKKSRNYNHPTHQTITIEQPSRKTMDFSFDNKQQIKFHNKGNDYCNEDIQIVYKDYCPSIQFGGKNE